MDANTTPAKKKTEEEIELEKMGDTTKKPDGEKTEKTKEVEEEDAAAVECYVFCLGPQVSGNAW